MAHCNSRGDVSLVILAAGLGRRFGGDKQLAGVGDSGKPLMYFSAMDAWRAGIRKLVMVVSPSNASLVRDGFLPLLPEDIAVTFVLQLGSDLPGGCAAAPRDKPWGTGHALWCAREAVQGPCIVINADDYYGVGAWPVLLEHFPGTTDWAMVSFPLAMTLSEHGAVNRGLCRVRDGFLQSVRECLSITRMDGEISGELDGESALLDARTPVSMNIWAFGTDVFELLERGLERFFANTPGVDEEFYLPELVTSSIAAREARVRVYPGRDQWLGITYREDLERAGSALRALRGALHA